MGFRVHESTKSQKMEIFHIVIVFHGECICTSLTVILKSLMAVRCTYVPSNRNRLDFHPSCNLMNYLTAVCCFILGFKSSPYIIKYASMVNYQITDKRPVNTNPANLSLGKSFNWTEHWHSGFYRTIITTLYISLLPETEKQHHNAVVA